MDTILKLSTERFEEGMTVQEFVEGMAKNRELFEERYHTFRLGEEDVEFFRGLAEEMNVLVLAEDWCGDVLRYLPALARIAETAPGWRMRIFRRDENLDLADMWLKDGQYRAIPVVVFFDSQMHEEDYFIEKPQGAYNDDLRAREIFAEQHPDLEGTHLPSGEMPPETYERYVEFIKEFRARNLERWQQMFVDELKLMLAA